MDKVLVIAKNNKCIFDLSRKICWNTQSNHIQMQFSSVSSSKQQYHRCTCSCNTHHEILNFKCFSFCTYRSPFFLPVCKFHFNSFVLKQYKMSKTLKNTVNKQKDFENTNWNIHSDPGLNEILETMKNKLESNEDIENNSEAMIHENNSEAMIHETDPELQNLLKEIREDFQEGKYETETPDDEKESDFLQNEQNSEILHVEETVVVEADDSTLSLAEEIAREDFTYVEEEEVEEWVPPIEMKRGVRGVFDISELVTTLQTENAKDICVIKMPEHLQFADYMVIVSGVSFRHCKAMSATIQWMYKRKKKSKDPSLRIEGLNSKDWLAYDLGNIILHIFLPEVRELYDLETLWTVGEKYDDRSLDIVDPFSIQQSDLEWLQELDIDCLKDAKKL